MSYNILPTVSKTLRTLNGLYIINISTEYYIFEKNDDKKDNEDKNKDDDSDNSDDSDDKIYKNIISIEIENGTVNEKNEGDDEAEEDEEDGYDRSWNITIKNTQSDNIYTTMMDCYYSDDVLAWFFTGFVLNEMVNKITLKFSQLDKIIELSKVANLMMVVDIKDYDASIFVE